MPCLLFLYIGLSVAGLDDLLAELFAIVLNHFELCVGSDTMVGAGNVAAQINQSLEALDLSVNSSLVVCEHALVHAAYAEQLLAGFTGAEVLIGNDYEIELIGNMTGLSREELLDRAKFVIVTYGSKGSVILSKGINPFEVPAVTPEAVLDPTGAGDSYRSGLLKGLHMGMRIPFAARLGAVSSSFCVEKYGTQIHHFTEETFRARFEAAFGPMPVLK